MQCILYISQCVIHITQCVINFFPPTSHISSTEKSTKDLPSYKFTPKCGFAMRIEGLKQISLKSPISAILLICCFCNSLKSH